MEASFRQQVGAIIDDLVLPAKMGLKVEARPDQAIELGKIISKLADLADNPAVYTVYRFPTNYWSSVGWWWFGGFCFSWAWKLGELLYGAT